MLSQLARWVALAGVPSVFVLTTVPRNPAGRAVSGTAAESLAVQLPAAVDSVPFLPPEVLRADGSQLIAHRLELEETTLLPGDSTDLDAYVYVTVESVQGWGERQLVIDWMALTWNGTGLDRNLVSETGLALRGRVTPRGVPFGSLVESHYFAGISNRTDVNPDGEVRRFDTLADRETGVHNEIIWPYLLSRMELHTGRSFVLPGYSPYRADPLFFKRFRVLGPVSIRDEQGNQFEGWSVESRSVSTLLEARELRDESPGRYTTYFVSRNPPYFLGKEGGQYEENGTRFRTKHWHLVGFDSLQVTSSRRVAEILRVRERRGADQIIPWQGAIGASRGR